jgi:CheY-like chemotaxis protein
MTEKNKPKVLMADDDEDDCFLAKEAFFETGAGVDFSCVLDGVELMTYLSEHCRSELEKLPRLILLDLNMPRKDGREALKEIKSEPALRNIPIIIFTTSKEEKDVDFAKITGAELFITKPAIYEEWVTIMKSLIERWLY